MELVKVKSGWMKNVEDLAVSSNQCKIVCQLCIKRGAAYLRNNKLEAKKANCPLNWRTMKKLRRKLPYIAPLSSLYIKGNVHEITV
ncbi:hypothetical protein Csa_003465 [Cucumis sativus]|uniref:Uncharacterized protein n=1 Tax=Cucumis sativus TaxID=3659 RepID=A0A0A0KHK0_CUCSA|nr:hypothetical protein Csa_003465 [Cucumis sativus]